MNKRLTRTFAIILGVVAAIVIWRARSANAANGGVPAKGKSPESTPGMGRGSLKRGVRSTSAGIPVVPRAGRVPRPAMQVTATQGTQVLAAKQGAPERASLTALAERPTPLFTQNVAVLKTDLAKVATVRASTSGVAAAKDLTAVRSNLKSSLKGFFN